MAGKTKPVSYHQGREYLTITELSQYKKNTHTKYPHQVERSRKLGELKRQQASKRVLLSFKVLTKNNTVCSLAIFWEVTKVSQETLTNSQKYAPYCMSSLLLHELTILLQQHLSSKAIRPLDWIQAHPKSVPSSFLGASILPQELTMETAGSSDNHIVRANGILKDV